MANCTHCNDTKRIPLFMPGSFAPCDWCAVPKAAAPAPEPEEDEEEDPVLFTIDGDEVTYIRSVHALDGGGAEVQTDEGEFIMFPDLETAGQAARAYWKSIAEDDPSEFTCMVGESTLVAWALGQSAGPGTTHVNSLEEWLDLWLDTPEEHFASYDSTERSVEDVTQEAQEEIGFSPGVAYKR